MKASILTADKKLIIPLIHSEMKLKGDPLKAQGHLIDRCTAKRFRESPESHVPSLNTAAINKYFNPMSVEFQQEQTSGVKKSHNSNVKH